MFLLMQPLQIPDVTSDIEEQLQGHDTCVRLVLSHNKNVHAPGRYRRRLAMARTTRQSHSSSADAKSNLLDKFESGRVSQVPSCAANARPFIALTFCFRTTTCG